MFNLSGIYVVDVTCSISENNTKQQPLMSAKFVQNTMVAALFTLFHRILKTTLK